MLVAAMVKQRVAWMVMGDGGKKGSAAEQREPVGIGRRGAAEGDRLVGERMVHGRKSSRPRRWFSMQIGERQAVTAPSDQLLKGRAGLQRERHRVSIDG